MRTARRLSRVRTVILGVSLLAAGESHALTKEARFFDDDRADDWAAGSSCLVRYYNACTGWIWLWGNWEDRVRVGVAVTNCLGPPGVGALNRTAVFTYSGGPAGYGFTGTIAAHNADSNQCPAGAAIGSQPFLPGNATFVVKNWGGLPVPSPFILVVTVREALWYENPVRLVTDHPHAGPTGPQACGVCYPSTRTTRSFYYGFANAPSCPGETFHDGVCEAEFLWEVSFSGEVGLDVSSWGQIKGLYR